MDQRDATLLATQRVNNKLKDIDYSKLTTKKNKRAD
jgi:hypothetical protein